MSLCSPRPHPRQNPNTTGGNTIKMDKCQILVSPQWKPQNQGPRGLIFEDPSSLFLLFMAIYCLLKLLLILSTQLRVLFTIKLEFGERFYILKGILMLIDISTQFPLQLK